MFWIVHVFALLLFWPALFITVPLHIIAGRMAPKTAPVQGPPPLPGQRPAQPASAAVPDWFTVLMLVMVGGFIWWMAKLPPTIPVASRSASSAPLTTPAAQPGVERFKVASDATAVYQLISVEGPQTARTIVTLREGSSGKTYSTRIYNCQTREVRQLGAAETIERMNAYKGPSSWAQIVPNSITDGIGGVACKRR